MYFFKGCATWHIIIGQWYIPLWHTSAIAYEGMDSGMRIFLKRVYRDGHYGTLSIAIPTYNWHKMRVSKLLIVVLQGNNSFSATFDFW